MPVSDQLVSETEKTATGTLVLDVPAMAPKRRSLPLVIFPLIVERSNLRYDQRVKPMSVVVFVTRVVAVPKFVAADDPSRTYASAVGVRTVCAGKTGVIMNPAASQNATRINARKPIGL